MNIIKLNAIDSTSAFLKDLSKKSELENFTTVVADEQHAGKGQMNTHWHSKAGKNLLFTTYVDFNGLPLEFGPYLSWLIATILRDVLAEIVEDKAKIKIKWPNDIMAYNFKIAGILVENTIKNNTIEHCYIGIGLNVNQLKFPEYLSKATSLFGLTNKEYDKEQILQKLLTKFQLFLSTTYLLKNKEQIKKAYLKHLYKINMPSMFKDFSGNIFMGKITDVSSSGLLLLEKEDEKHYSYAVKEIKFL